MKNAGFSSQIQHTGGVLALDILLPDEEFQSFNNMVSLRRMHSYLCDLNNLGQVTGRLCLLLPSLNMEVERDKP